jgi:polysaccharide pyruvyl transferase CsaB
LNIKTKKKAIILGWYGHNNLGDELLLDSVLSFFKPFFNSFYYQSPSDLRKKNAASFFFHSKRSYFYFILMLLKVSTVILGGGTIIRDTGKNSNQLNLKLMLLSISLLLRKNVIFFGSGMGPFHSSKPNFLLRFVLKKATFISFRDLKSFKIMREITDRKGFIVSDPVFYLFRNDIKNETRIYDKSDFIGFALRPWKNAMIDNEKPNENNNFNGEIVSFLNNLSKKHKRKIKLLCFQTENKYDTSDDLYYQSLINKYDCKFEYEISIIKKDIISIKNDFKSLKFLVGMRLHSLILASIFNIPMMGISYDPKIKSFMHNLSISNYSIDFAKVTNKRLMSIEKKIYNQKYDLKKYLNNVDKYQSIFNDLKKKL